MANHYETLQVTRDADPEVIERAYRTLSRKHHPDRRPATESAAATRRMQALNEAYGVLKDPVRRAAYDATLPPVSAHAPAWDVFLERGLVGMSLDRFRSS